MTTPTPTPADAVRQSITALRRVFRNAKDQEVASSAIMAAADAILPRPAIGDRSPQADASRLLHLQFLALVNDLTGNPAPAASQEALAEAREESQAAAWQGIEPEQVLPAVEALAAAIEPTTAKDLRVRGFDVERLAARLDELANYVTQGPDCVCRNFTMRVPAEPYRDPDLVLSAAASLLRNWPTTPKGAAPALPPALVFDGGDGARIQATNRERTRWVIQLFGRYLNIDGKMESDRALYPASHDDAFLARIHWPSAEAAYAALLEYRASASEEVQP